MESEKTAAEAAIVRFASVGEANRRIAGVAAAARIARTFADAGESRLWLAVPDAAPLDDAALADLSRLWSGEPIRIVDGTVLAGRDEQGPAIRDAPQLSTWTVLRATGKPNDGIVSRWLNRPVSRLISALLLHLPGVRPIHATLGSALLAPAMFACLVLGGPTGLIAGGLLFHGASVLDGVDGEIARATFRTSAAGAALDSAVDLATNLLFVSGLAINLALAGEQRAVVAGVWGLALFGAGMAAIGLSMLRAKGPFTFELVKRDSRMRFGGRAAATFVAVATKVSSRDFFALLFAVLILAGLPEAVLYLFAAAATLWILFVVIAILGRNVFQPVERSA